MKKDMKMKKGKMILKIILIVLVVLIVFTAAVYINHITLLKKEEALLAPLGQLAEVEGNKMSVYIEGKGNTTLVFMSGGGTCSPILDFRTLYSRLSDEYKVAVVEKFGYGYSDISDKERDIDSILEDTRAALSKSGLTAPYVLCPHSMSGLEALYWAQKYPDEVTAIIGLDMAVPEYYDTMKINLPIIRLGGAAAEMGFTRLIPDISESDAIKHGTLTEEEKNIYRAVFYSRTATKSMINECESVKANAMTVKNGGVPQLPVLLFISDGSGGTGFDKESWRRIPKEYISQISGGEYIELDCPHYVHNYEYEKISDESKAFLDRVCVMKGEQE